MKNKIIKIIAGILASAGIFLIGISVDLQDNKLSGVFQLNEGCYTSAATSTLTQVGIGSEVATSTLTCQIGSAESVDMRLIAKGEVSTSVLLWRYEFSNNGVDWFAEDSKALSGTTYTHTVQPLVHSLSLATSTLPVASDSIFQNIPITGLQSKWLRVSFKPVVATSSVNIAIVKKDIIK